jgi:quinolinate synthase
LNLVNRLAKRHPDKFVTLLAPDLCMCATMFRISPENLLWSLENLVDGHVVNRIRVDEDTERWAKVSLDRMLAIQ